ncbi:MAG: hypothetical protein AAF787_18080 [Chloroflexota bacterium]
MGHESEHGVTFLSIIPGTAWKAYGGGHGFDYLSATPGPRETGFTDDELETIGIISRPDG